jgi:hypothetical protein
MGDEETDRSVSGRRGRGDGGRGSGGNELSNDEIVCLAEMDQIVIWNRKKKRTYL